jgi:hypothetical protein
MVVFFGLGGASERLRLDLPGWSQTEKLFTWTEGRRASIALRLPRAKRAIKLQFKMSALVSPPALPAQPVDVSVNGEKLATWYVADERIHTLTLPKRFAPVSDSLLHIDFDIPQATSPAALGHSTDSRRLGLCVRELRIRKGPKKRKPSAPPATAALFVPKRWLC